MLDFNQEHFKELCDLIRYDNAVLFLGQDYQNAICGNSYFMDEINSQICKKKVSDPTYPSLWAKMSEISNARKTEGGHSVLDSTQINGLKEIGNRIPQNKRLADVLNAGWASVVTSSIDPGIVNAEGVNCNPIYNVNTRPAGIANKRKLHITYLFGCVSEENSFPLAYKLRGQARTNAETMYSRVLKEAIRYNGALVIDGWNPCVDWASVDTVLGNSMLDADMPVPKIYIFNCSSEVKGKIYESERTEELAESDKLIISEQSLYDCLEEFISEICLERKAEQEAFESSEVISFQRGKKTVSINIPREQLRELDPERIHLLTPRDRLPVSLDQEGIRNLTIKFLANSNDNFPYWQGYLQNCCFDRDIYKNEEKTGLYDRTVALLQAPNLHKVNSTVIIHGPSNSGKTMLLGRLALELSQNYPVLFINGEIEADDPEITSHRYQSLVNFINTYLTRNSQMSGRVRAAVIWDNDAFVDKLQSYTELARELAESNAILIGSAYEIRNEEVGNRKTKKGVEYLPISPILNSGSEFRSMEKMLRQNLGEEFVEVFSRVRKDSAPRKGKPDLINDDNRILTLLQRTFRAVNDAAAQIIDEAVIRTNKETAGTEKQMRNRFELAMQNASKIYNTDMKGLGDILTQCTEEAQKEEEWYRQLEVCAPTLNDLLAVAGQFGIRLPLNLVKEVICDSSICPDIRYYMDAVDDILRLDTMLEYPFPVDEVGHVMVGYRSPEEAEIYLNTHYNRRGNVDTHVQYDSEGKPFLEDREIFLLEKLIEYSNLEDYSHYNWHTVTTVRELLDQFGSNSRKGESYAKKYEYKYDELATFILNHGGSENPEMALSAAFLKREKLRASMLNSVRYNRNISDKELEILNSAADGLEHAIEIEERDNTDETPRMMRIYVEWCTNRNYVLNRENPSTNDIELFHQIHRRFSKALSIYMRIDHHRMKPMSMMDVYLNAFNYFVMAMEKLYHVQSDAKGANPVKVSEYTDEISYAMNTILGKLLDFDDIEEARENLNSNILLVYQLSQKAIDSLKTTARAHGSGAFILLSARSMWFRQNVDIEKLKAADLKTVDLYLTSDFSEKPGNTSLEMIQCARNVYDYLTRPDNLNVLLSDRSRREKEIASLEMLIRAAWISKTENVPFTLNQFPKLSKKDWDEIHRYCRAYVESGNDRAKYAFAYYFEGIYYWSFTTDTWSSVSGRTKSQEKFDLCFRTSIKPRGVYSSDSYIFLCEPETGEPIKLNARVKKDRDEADISSAVDPSMIKEMPEVINRQRIYCAQSLKRRSQRNRIESQVITIRFNLKGALAGPENLEMEANSYGKE
jgi:GTPase SAR1 family protein